MFQSYDKIENNTKEITENKKIYEMFNKCEYEKVLDYMYDKGYILPTNINKKMREQFKPKLNIRKQNVLKRYKLWKNMRNYLKGEFYPFIENIMYPGEKNLILDLSKCKDTIKVRKEIYKMIINYIPIYDIYMYNTIPNTGYKYHILVYN